MTLIKDTGRFFAWLLAVMRTFFLSNPKLTAGIVAISVVARIVSIVAFLVPLKVILLAGSERIPRYFPFIDQAHRTEWIVGLSVGAVVLYVLSLWLETVRKTLAQIGGGQVLRASTDVFVNSSHEEDARSVYLRVVTVVTNMVFFVTGAVVIALLDFRLMLWLGAYIPLAYLVFAVWASPRTRRRFPSLAARLEDNFKKYVRVASTIGFLTSFLVVLFMLLTATEPNIAIAIVLFILLRQVLSAAVGVAVEGVQISSKRDQFNAILFRGHQWREAESKDALSLREVFSPGRRSELAAAELASHVVPGEPLQVRWLDSGSRGVQCFEVSGSARDHSPFLAIQMVYRPTQRHLLANEDFLFSFVEREALGAPEILADFIADGYASRIVAAGGSTEVPREKWQELFSRQVAKMWSIRPGQAMIDGYRSTHRLLEERLDRTLLKKLAVALDGDDERKLYYSMLARLPAIQARLRKLPLVLANPELTRANSLFLPASAEIRPMLWGKWQLVRLGGELPAGLSGNEREEALRGAGLAREDLRHVSNADLELAERCGSLERLIDQGSYKAALAVIGELLDQAQADKPVPAVA